MVQHMVKAIQSKCLLKAWPNGMVLGLTDRQEPVRGSMCMEVHIELLHLRNGRDCLMFTPQANMKMTLTEITIGNSGNGNTDILKALNTKRHLFIPSCVRIVLDFRV